MLKFRYCSEKIFSALKEKIGCCSKLGGKKYGMTFLIGCNSQFFIAAANFCLC